MDVPATPAVANRAGGAQPGAMRHSTPATNVPGLAPPSDGPIT